MFCFLFQGDGMCTFSFTPLINGHDNVSSHRLSGDASKWTLRRTPHTHTHTHTPHTHHTTHTHTHTHRTHTHTHTHTHTLHSLQNDISTCKAPDNLRPITRKRQEHDRNKNTFTSVYCLISISALYTRTIYFYITPHTRHLDANFIFYILHLIYVVR